MEPISTKVDTISEIWNLIASNPRPFAIYIIRGGTNLFGESATYIGSILIAEGNIAGTFVNHWTGKLYTANGALYNANDIHFAPV